MHDDARVALNLEQLATMTDRLLLRAGRVPSAVMAAATPSRRSAPRAKPAAKTVAQRPVAKTVAKTVATVEVTADRFSVPSLAKRGRQARVSPPIDRAPTPAPRAACALDGSTVHGYAPAPRGPEPVAPAAFAKGSLSPEQLAHEAFPPEPVAQAAAYETAARAVVARGSVPRLAPAAPGVIASSTTVAAPTAPAVIAAPAAPLAWRARPDGAPATDLFEPERTLCVRPLPSPVPISLATRAVRALRSPSFAVKILLPALVGAVLGLVAML